MAGADQAPGVLAITVRVQPTAPYTPQARWSTRRLASGRRPYGHGSTARGEKDRCEIVLAGAIVIYYVSQAMAMVAAVTVISV